jgi:5-methylcytosine-specific restriction endonuclease McrA
MTATDNALAIATGIMQFLIQNPVLVLILVGIIAVFVIAQKVRGSRTPVTDEKRMFSGPEKAECKRRAGNRCEHSQFGFRCRVPSAHADHVYPWARGGATAMSNCQSLCAPHNLRKSATIPGKFYIARLEKRRRKYFPSGVPRKVEWRLGLAE